MTGVPIRCGAVSLVALRPAGAGHEVLLMRRTRPPRGAWCQVAGGIEEGETAWQAALRELAEETGLRPLSLHSADFCEQLYEPVRNCINLLPVFVAQVAADAAVTLNHEHDAFRWCTRETALTLVDFPGQRALLSHVFAQFCDRAPSPHLRIPLPG